MTIAVIVINYNYGAFLGECLESIPDKGDEDLRVIIVDDASTDDSVAIATEWASTSRLRVNIIAKPDNAGPASAYNTARRNLQEGDTFLAFIDADDVFGPHRFTEQIRAMRERTNLAVVYSDAKEFGEGVDGRISLAKVPNLKETVTEQLLRKASLCALNSALIRRTALDQTPLLDEKIRVCDYPMWLSLSRAGEFAYIPGIVAGVRVHSSSMSRSETLISDRLAILGRQARSPSERKAARDRGRGLMNSALVRGRRPRLRSLVEYSWGTRDWMAAPVAIATRLPGSKALINAIRSRCK